MLDLIIILNNYFHDVATAVLLSSAVIMWVLGRRAQSGGPGELSALAGAYPTLTKFAIGAIVWIILGGVPRIIFFNTHEFIPAVENGLVTVLVIKHALMFTAVALGIVLWLRAKRTIEAGAKAQEG